MTNYLRANWTIAILVLSATAALSHLCNNVYRTPDRLVVKPEKTVISMDKEEEFRVFVKNNYPRELRNVRLTVKANDEALNTSISPPAIQQLLPGQKDTFQVKVTANPQAAAGTRTLAIGINADPIGYRPVEETSDATLRQLASGGNPSWRVHASESLARRGDPYGMQVLQELAVAGDRDISSRAIRAMALCGHKENVETIRQYLNRQDGLIRGNALLALGALNADTQIIRPYAYRENGERDRFVIACGIAGLAMLGDKSMVPALQKVFDDPDIHVRIAAGWGVGMTGDKAGVDVLEKAWNDAGGDCEPKVFAGDALVCISNKT